MIDSIAKMKDLRVLIVTDKPVLGYFEPTDQQVIDKQFFELGQEETYGGSWEPGDYDIETSREEYERVYLDNLEETLGTKFVTAPQEELFDKVKKASKDKAEKIAQKWIDKAITLRGTNKSEVVKSAKLYLAMKEMMDEHNCGAVTTEGFGWPPIGFQKAEEKGIPSQGMPTSQLLTDGIVATSETLTDCLLTQQLGLYITGSAGLLGDYNIDPFNNTAIICHCEGTFNPYGDERRTPYILRNLPFVEENTGGACAEAHYPINETVTVAKISIYKKKLSLFTGETVSGEDLYPYWKDILGRNKIAVKTDAEALLKNVDWKTYGNHRTAFFGDYRQEFKDLAKLIGFEVEEKDK